MIPRKLKSTAAVGAAALLTVSLAACGGGGDGDSGSEDAGASQTTGGGPTVQIAADPDGALKFDPSTATAKAGKTTIDFENSAALPHDLVLDGPDGEKVGETKIFSDGEESFDADLKPGTYTFYCSVPGHEESGMKGTLTVSK